MAPSIPKPKVVESAFRVLGRRLETTLARVNKEAAGQMKAGDYEAAQLWMDLGRAVSDFKSRSDAFADEWKTLVRSTRVAGAAAHEAAHRSERRPGRGAVTPVWKFYKPVLAAIDQGGGELDLSSILRTLAPMLASTLTARDIVVGGRGKVPRWHVTVRRVRRQAQKEGWLERGRGDVWRLTEQGRRFGMSGDPEPDQ